MAKRLLVEGLDWAVTEGQLMRVFTPFGDLDEARIAVDWETGRSRGFGYVTFRDSGDAESAMAGLDGQKLSGKTLRVMVAPELTARSNYRGGDYGQADSAETKASGYRSADYDGPKGSTEAARSRPATEPATAAASAAAAEPAAARTDRKLYRSADFGYVQRPEVPEPAQPAGADAKGKGSADGARTIQARPNKTANPGSLGAAKAVPAKAGAAPSSKASKKSSDPEEALSDEERVNRAKFGGWKEGDDNDGGVGGGGGSTFG